MLLLMSGVSINVGDIYRFFSSNSPPYKTLLFSIIFFNLLKLFVLTIDVRSSDLFLVGPYSFSIVLIISVTSKFLIDL